MHSKWSVLIAGIVVVAAFSCNNNPQSADKPVLYRGLYRYGPEAKSFQDCDNGAEYWAVDSSAKLELSYSQLNFEKPNEPMYVEIEGKKIRSSKEGMGAEFDSTIVVKKLIKITKVIPQDMCN